jgi:hypothetical protein
VLKIIQRFGTHCSCHLQGEYVLAEQFLGALYREVDGELDLISLIGGAEEQAINHAT